ncbi:MAG: cytidine deaminase [Ignavibacteriales bacterium]|nr:cytidine deaminase [Ignavibacteriales bacterium]
MRENYRTLIQASRNAKRRAHAPYSGFHVGAALLTSDGVVFTGCNVENSSYGLTICAERTAIFKAISEGKKKFKAIAITSDGTDVTPPCGACRQVLWDLAGNIDVVLDSHSGIPLQMKLESLLPIPFSEKRLKAARKRKS